MTDFTLSDGTPHREPVLAAIPCPPDRMPMNATKCAKLAMANAWRWEATYAIGYGLGKTEDGQEVHSVVFRAARRGRRVAASWRSKPGAEKMEFEGGWLKTPGELPLALASAALFAELMEPVATPVRPT